VAVEDQVEPVAVPPVEDQRHDLLDLRGGEDRLRERLGLALETHLPGRVELLSVVGDVAVEDQVEPVAVPPVEDQRHDLLDLRGGEDRLVDGPAAAGRYSAPCGLERGGAS